MVVHRQPRRHDEHEALGDLLGGAEHVAGDAADLATCQRARAHHSDERGTEEYNRSLAERRALALREELIRFGIDPTRVDTITYGEDRPAAIGHSEQSWGKNRRGEFVLLTPPK